jgi:hypothetical protein
MNMAADDVIHLEALYPYAYQGRDMFAITYALPNGARQA